MDATRFDSLARTLTLGSRRGAIGGLLLGGTLGLAELTQSEAKKKRKKRKKKKGKACTAPTVKCGKACVDPAADPVHCGSCGNACGATQICAGGTCVAGIGTCAAGANTCVAPETISCNGDPECFCFRTQAGATRCARYSQQPDLKECEADADCADRGVGAFCPRHSNSCGGVCAIPC